MSGWGSILTQVSVPRSDHCASTPLAGKASMTIQDGIPIAGFPSGGGERARSQKWVDKPQANNYWSGTEYSANPDNAWNFNFNNGNQNVNNKDNNNYALVVRPGE